MRANATIYSPATIERRPTVGIDATDMADMRIYELDQFIIWLQNVRIALAATITDRRRIPPSIRPFDSDAN